MATFTDTAVVGRRSGKAPEKMKFSQTCSLLSQFLKEKRGSGDSSTPEIFGKMETKGSGIAANTRDLLGKLKQNSDGALKPNTTSSSAMDFLPQLVENPCIKKSNVRSTGSVSPQMTIFYAGKLLVFDSFPPEKATEIMEMATKLASATSSTKESSPAAQVTTEKLKTNSASETPRSGNQDVAGSDMRYPRRASLLKFLEKRKERVIARGPYQINNNPTKVEGSSSGGEPEDSGSKQFDLNM